MLRATALFFLLSSVSLLAQESELTDDVLQKQVDTISPRVAEIRGWDWKHSVPAGVHTPDQFLAFAQKDFEEEYGMEKFRAMGEAYRLLGLIDPEIEDLYATVLELLKDQVGGYYDPKSKKFYMISTFNTGDVAQIIMAHELCHALDDQYFDLDAMTEKVKGNSDAEFAMRAVVEGSATSLMTLYSMRGAQEGWIDPMRMVQEQQTMLEQQSESLENAPPYLVITLALPYLEGNKFIVKSKEAATAGLVEPPDEDLKRVFAEPPLSSEQVLHFEKYWDPEQRDDPQSVELPDFSSQLGEGWAIADHDVLGELGAFVLTADELPNFADSMSLISAKWTNRAATGWDGDTYQYYRGPESQQVVRWSSVWDSESDSREFVEAMKEIAYNRNAFMVSAESRGDAATVWFANKAGKPFVDELRALAGESVMQ